MNKTRFARRQKLNSGRLSTAAPFYDVESKTLNPGDSVGYHNGFFLYTTQHWDSA